MVCRQTTCYWGTPGEHADQDCAIGCSPLSRLLRLSRRCWGYIPGLHYVFAAPIRQDNR
jgi:hypothetical protein